jgi:hypothetical protein
MTAEKVVPVEPGSDVDQFLRQADEHPIIAVVHGRRFRVAREPNDIFANYDPERVKVGLAASVGAFAGIDGEALKNELREERSQNSRGRPG